MPGVLRRELAAARQKAHDVANEIAPLQLDLVMAREDVARLQAEAAALMAELEAARKALQEIRSPTGRARTLDQIFAEYDAAVKARSE